MPNLKIHSVEWIDLDWDELSPKEQDRLLRQKRSRENAKMEAELYPPMIPPRKDNEALDS